MPQIVAMRVKDEASRDAIAVVLSQDAVCVSPSGEPWSAVSLNAALARSFAKRLLDLANEIEGPEQNQEPYSREPAAITSILVFHDGSAQSHRAFYLALDLALRSSASIQLVGIYGVRQDRCEPSALDDDYVWQRGWLERLLQMYSLQAEQGAVDLRTILVAATSQEELSEIFDCNKFDLVVLPRRFSEDGAMSSGLGMIHQSLTGAAESSILFCS